MNAAAIAKPMASSPRTPGQPVRTVTGELSRTGVAGVRLAVGGGAPLAAGYAIAFAGRCRRRA